jgi:outer membrane protein assembly factor BamB
MSDLRSVLRERRRSYEPSPGGFDRLVRRRRRKQRNQRLAAGLVALVVTVAGTWGLVAVSRSLGTPTGAATIDASNVHRLDVAWTAAVGDTPTPPVVGGNLVFVGSGSGVLYALDVDGGEVVWLGRLRGSIRSAPAVSGDEVIVHTTAGLLAAFRTTCGTRGATCLPTWTARTGDDAGSPPSIAGGMVYVNTGVDRLLAFPARCRADGDVCRPAWRGVVDVFTGTNAIVAPALVDGSVWTVLDTSATIFQASCRTDGGRCEPINAQFTGAMRTGPVVGGDMVFLGSESGYVYGFPADCANPCGSSWRAVASEPTEPAVAGGVVYITGAPGGGLAAISQGCRSAGTPCTPSWTGDLHGSPTSSVVVANGVVYAGSSDGNLYAFPTTCPETGTVCAPAAVVRIGSSIAKPAVYGDRALLVTARDGTLRALTVAGVDI